MTTTFGELIKQLRTDRRITLRTFAQAVSTDPANYSKIERGKLLPPSDPMKLEPYRKALGLKLDSQEWREIIRLASLGRGAVPPAILNDQELMGKLPALFRSLEGDPVDDTVLDELIAAIRRE